MARAEERDFCGFIIHNPHGSGQLPPLERLRTLWTYLDHPMVYVVSLDHVADLQMTCEIRKTLRVANSALLDVDWTTDSEEQHRVDAAIRKWRSEHVPQHGEVTGGPPRGGAAPSAGQDMDGRLRS
ncbi:hypothetical protein [Nocardia sp. XZ_19_385]|uniref:hypothetical protein n=1 Tax=Nocardia sp. XZ_19_385 TaxID=2769488 RepID=UPI00188E0CEE|nr:hypothetical protein [Nocardia sp. XZ_19_385]